ncbi:MAG: helix-turn-helix domain-containing protein [Vicinamibacterales bacterium]
MSLSERDRDLVETWSRSRTLPSRLVQRSRIVLLLADGRRVADVASQLGVSATTVRLWRQRFEKQGAAGLLNDAPGRGRKPALDAMAREALRKGQRDGDSMSVRARARELGVSAATVSRWKRRGN